jgi:TnpA family transposase
MTAGPIRHRVLKTGSDGTSINEVTMSKKQSTEEYSKDVDKVNQFMTNLAASVAKNYVEPVFEGTTDEAIFVARRLATQYKTLNFSLTVRNDGFINNVYAEPVFKPFERNKVTEENSDSKLAVMAKSDSYFPSYDVVKSHGAGLAVASRLESEAEEMKKKYEDLRNEFHRMKMMFMPPPFMW